MKKIVFFLIALLIRVTVWGQDIPTLNEVGPACMPSTIADMKAPFDMPRLKRPDFGKRTMTVKLKLGQKATAQIQEAIDRISKQGGGTVVIPKGKWTTGRLTLKSGVCLNIPLGAELSFSGEVTDYQPTVFTRDEGIELYSTGACIYANGAQNIGVTGQGLISGPPITCELFQRNEATSLNLEAAVSAMPLAQRQYDGIASREIFLPKTIAPINCRNVLIEGVTLRQGLYWNVVPQYCENVIVRGVTVESFGHGRTDGIDIESSRNVLIEYCSLDCGDDCYTMKSGRGTDGIRVNRPTENVVIRYCLARRGAGGIVCGTETAGNIRNIYMHDCVFDGTSQAFRFKTRRPRGGGACQVTVERVRANVSGSAFYCDMLGSARWVGELASRLPVRPVNELTPIFSNFCFRNIIIESCNQLFDIQALPEQPLQHVSVSNLQARCKKMMRLTDVNDFTLDQADIMADDDRMSMDGCRDIRLTRVSLKLTVNAQ